MIKNLQSTNILSINLFFKSRNYSNSITINQPMASQFLPQIYSHYEVHTDLADSLQSRVINYDKRE